MAIEYRWLEGQYRSAAGARGRSGAPPGGRDRSARHYAAALAAKTATTTIPIVFGGDDPVQHGLVASLRSTGRQRHRHQLYERRAAAKRLGILHELRAQGRDGLPCSSIRQQSGQWPRYTNLQSRACRKRPRAIGRQIDVLNASTSREIDAAFASLARKRPDALFVARRRILHRPPRATRHLGGALQNSSGLSEPRVCRSRRTDELRNQHRGPISPSRRLYRPNSQGRQSPPTCRSCSRPSSSWSSTSRPPRRSASPSRKRCWPPPTR